MASIRTIYIQENLNEKLKKVENVSELISHLLTDYFNEREQATSPDALINEIISDENSEKKQLENKEKFFVAIYKSLSDFLDRPATKEEVEEYIFRFKNQENVNLFDYAEELKNAKQQLQ